MFFKALCNVAYLILKYYHYFTYNEEKTIIYYWGTVPPVQCENWQYFFKYYWIVLYSFDLESCCCIHTGVGYFGILNVALNLNTSLTLQDLCLSGYPQTSPLWMAVMYWLILLFAFFFFWSYGLHQQCFPIVPVRDMQSSALFFWCCDMCYLNEFNCCLCESHVSSDRARNQGSFRVGQHMCVHLCPCKNLCQSQR